MKNGMPLATAARAYDVLSNTLRYKIRSGYSRPLLGGHVTFTTEQEKKLEERLYLLHSCGYGLTINDLRHVVYQYAEKIRYHADLTKSPKWQDMNGFIHSCSVRKAEALPFTRAKATRKENVDKFFAQLSKCYDDLHLWTKPGNIFNCDESQLQLIYKPGKVISVRGKREVHSQTNAEKMANGYCCSVSIGYCTILTTLYYYEREEKEGLISTRNTTRNKSRNVRDRLHDVRHFPQISRSPGLSQTRRTNFAYVK